MAKKESRSTALILLGIVVIIAVVGVILLYSGAKTGKAYYYPNSGVGVYQSDKQFYPSAREACLRAVHCQDGGGAVLISEPTSNPAICVCPEHFFPTTVFDWTALRLGEMPAPRDYNQNAMKKIIWQTQSAMYTTGGSRVYETPGTYQKLGTFNSY